MRPLGTEEEAMGLRIGLALACVGGWLALMAVGTPGCSSDAEPVKKATASGGSGGSSTAEGGTGGMEPEGRGDPADFPAQCIESCSDACDALKDCGGETSSLYPLSRDDCIVRCGMAENGPVWDDQSANFKCCASQTSCSKVKHCGGWLAHPAGLNSCDKLCNCFFSEALQALWHGHPLPAGYRVAPREVFVDVGANQAAKDELSRVAGVARAQGSRRVQVTLDRDGDAQTVTALSALGRLLPTVIDAAGRVSAVTGTIVLSSKTPADWQNAAKIAATHGLSLTRKLSYAKNVRLLDGPDPWRALDAAAELSAQPGLTAELDMLRYHERRYTPDDPLFDDQWHLLNVGQGESTVSVDARVSEAWDLTLGDAEVIVAVHDDGVDTSHPDFAGKLEPSQNYPDNWMERIALGTLAGHGTSVAGVAAAKADDAVGGAGVCPKCRVLPRILGEVQLVGFQATDVDIADGFKALVDAGAWVINNSWGLGTGQPTYVDSNFPMPPLPKVVSEAFDYAESSGRSGKGTVIVYAAGNSNDKLDYYASHPNIVTVAAVGDLGLKSYYSSFGKGVDIAAPSNGALTGITTSQVGGGHTDSFGGTSSAAPLVTGVIGLMFSANKDLTAAQVRDKLTLSAAAIDPVFGAWSEGHSVFYGAGMVNAYVAVQLANGSCADPASCPAPSDDCAGNCDTKTSCQACRTDADCAADHVCQALPSLGALVCVAAKGAGCADGTTETNGYCLPSLQTCGLCGSEEACNGRDDDCDGKVDEDDVCEGSARCFIDGLGCEAGKVCAGARCTNSCTTDDECGSGAKCKTVKDQYGQPGTKG